MKIAIDISQIVYGTGVSIYTQELVRNLLKIDMDNSYILFGGSIRRKSEIIGFINTLRTIDSKVIPLSPTVADFIWNRLHIWNIEKFTGRVDVFHSSDWTQPPTNAFKVTTVHDLSPIKFQSETPMKIVDVHKRRLYWVMREVDRIIVPTNSIKKDMVELGADEKRIRVIYEAAGDNFKKADKDQINLTKKKFNIHEDYIMTVGVGDRKNTRRLIEAYEKSKKVGKLVVVGGGKMELETRGVIRTGYVSDSDLAALYSGAKALVYPSLYEGFGLPILQAMKCECPVVTSDLGSMKEVSGDAAILVDPMSVNSIADGIDKAVASPKTLAKKGTKRVHNFSWEKAAKQTLEVYKEAKK